MSIFPWNYVAGGLLLTTLLAGAYGYVTHGKVATLEGVVASRDATIGRQAQQNKEIADSSAQKDRTIILLQDAVALGNKVAEGVGARIDALKAGDTTKGYLDYVPSGDDGPARPVTMRTAGELRRITESLAGVRAGNNP